MTKKRKNIFDHQRVKTKRQKSLRHQQSEEKRSQYRESDRIRHACTRNNETVEDRTNRLQKKKEHTEASKKRNWMSLYNEAFNYNYQLDYFNFPQINIGCMTVECKFCHAFKFECESSGFCCSNGKVLLNELPELPEPLKSLINGDHKNSKEFLTLIRKYNSSFQMTSFGTSMPMLNSNKWITTFKIQGQVYHKVGSLMPLPNEERKFLQIYFLGNEQIETQRRISIVPGVNENLIKSLQKMLHENNYYVKKFKMALDNHKNDDLKIIIKANKKPPKGHDRIFNTPVVNEVAIIIAGNEFESRDIVLTTRNNQLQNISETHISYDALQYPLMFPRGEDGYTININQVQPGTSHKINKMVSAMNFYAYRLMIRSKENHLLNYRQLLNQYLVDMYAKIETERLLYIRLNQKKLRVDEYIHLKDAIMNDENSDNHGKLVILPSTYTGGPRNMHEYAQDAITYVRYGGKPSLFITFTFNPNCKEMNENLIHGQSKIDRHDLIARIFRQKLIKLMNVIIKGKIFGTVKYWLYSVEWQKRGLPHAHILIWLKQTLRANQIDDIILAEIPDPIIDNKLHTIVIKNMVHGPCGPINPQSTCMKDKFCSKMFPRKFMKETQTETNGYPLYRRRNPEDGGQTAKIKIKSTEIEIDNRWIVPYNQLLLRMFDSHINVECCNSVQAIKYILKYVHKGSDQGVFAMTDNNQKDEISEFQAGRYISSNEAAWRIFGFPIHERYPTVVHLDVHLENGQRVYFNKNNLKNILTNPPNTKLTAFFELCKSDDFAKTLLYYEIPKFYTWDVSKKIFHRRKQGEDVEGHIGIKSNDALGRVYTIHPKNFECYYLRMLLHKIRGPTCFTDLKTIDGKKYHTFHEACLASGLLENDNQWHEALIEAKECDSPSKIRNLFAVILSFCEPSNPKELWDIHKDCMSEDILHNLRQKTTQMMLDFNDDIYNEALIIVEDKILKMIGKSLSEMGMTSPSRQQSLNLDREIMTELSYDTNDMLTYVAKNKPLLNSDQKLIYDEFERRYKDNESGIIFIDAPGGTGKTFLINLLLARIRADKKIALAVASSGIASTLLTGGRTAHSTLQIPIDLIYNESPICNIKKRTGKARLLQKAKAIFWDEISMMHKHGVEAVNRTLQDIRGNDNIMGGLILVIAGDFRQTLPVIPNGTMVDEIKACLKSSHIWKEVFTMQLTINMRLQSSNNYNSLKFSKYLLNIGNGQESINHDTGKIQLTDEFYQISSTLKNLIDCVYPNIEKNLWNKRWLQERAILTPLNVKVNQINECIQEKITLTSKTFFSIDKCVNQDEITNYPVEFLNSLDPNGIPPHELKLKIGSPIMLLRNLDPPKLCNGSRLTVKKLHNHVIEATILIGPYEGEDVFIPRIPLIPSDLPFSFKRLQFPIRLAFAITINKSQGQSLQVVGLDLTDECFSHGQLYVGMSRSKDPSSLYIIADQEKQTKNVVYKQVL